MLVSLFRNSVKHMRLITKYTIIAALLISGLSLKASDPGDIGRVKSQILNAISTADFKKAKHEIHKLLPILKKEIKTSQKELGASAKSLEKSELAEIEETIEKNQHTYDKLHQLVHASPAAIRVKKQEVFSLVFGL